MWMMHPHAFMMHVNIQYLKPYCPLYAFNYYFNLMKNLKLTSMTMTIQIYTCTKSQRTIGPEFIMNAHYKSKVFIFLEDEGTIV